MLGYVPGETIGHRLDPRSKLAFQLAFAAVAFAHTSPTGLASLTVLALLVAVGSGLSILRAIRSVRILAPFLVGAPIVAALTFGPPWIDPTAAIDPALASYRVVLIVLVSAAYVRTTPVRDSRAAIQRTIPGRFGVLLGVGVSLVFRFLPALRRELRSIRSAEVARLGSARSVGDRIGLLATVGLRRSLRRADRLSVALRARCFAWNPTLPALSFGPVDGLVVVASIVLLWLGIG